MRKYYRRGVVFQIDIVFPIGYLDKWERCSKIPGNGEVVGNDSRISAEVRSVR